MSPDFPCLVFQFLTLRGKRFPVWRDPTKRRDWSRSADYFSFSASYEVKKLCGALLSVSCARPNCRAKTTSGERNRNAVSRFSSAFPPKLVSSVAQKNILYLQRYIRNVANISRNFDRSGEKNHKSLSLHLILLSRILFHWPAKYRSLYANTLTPF